MAKPPKKRESYVGDDADMNKFSKKNEGSLPKTYVNSYRNITSKERYDKTASSGSSQPPRKLTKAEEAEVLRRKGNRYTTGASDKAMANPKSVGNVIKENRNPGTNVLGYKKTMARIADVRKQGAKPDDDKNQRKETLEALRAVGEINLKEYAKRKKAIK